MGFFSWNLSNTRKPIRNIETRNPTRDFFIVTPQGNIPVSFYDGYGRFITPTMETIDIHILLAITNGENPSQPLEVLRSKGIELECGDREKECKFPLKFSKDARAKYNKLRKATRARCQGYF